ncbi:hypothetical protein ACJX0J_022293 [Zea mays]
MIAVSIITGASQEPIDEKEITQANSRSSLASGEGSAGMLKHSLIYIYHTIFLIVIERMASKMFLISEHNLTTIENKKEKQLQNTTTFKTKYIEANATGKGKKAFKIRVYKISGDIDGLGHSQILLVIIGGSDDHHRE